MNDSPLVFPPFETKDAATLMARDAQFLHEAESPDFPFTFHAFQWERACITCGYLQKPERWLDMAYLTTINAPVVRRPTGGKLAFHGNDLAYSITVHAGRHPVRRLVLGWIEILAESLRSLGIPATAGAERRSDGWLQPLCGVERGPADILLEGRKLAGHSFRKAGPALQLQGTLAVAPPGPDVQRLWKALRAGTVDAAELASLPPAAPPPAELAAAFAEALRTRS